jgi:hypothetical protein
LPSRSGGVRRLGLLERPEFAAWAAAALLDCPIADAEVVVERLVDAQLLDIAGEDATGQTRYRFHDLLRLFAQERLHAEEAAADRQAALARALGAWLALAERANARLAPTTPRPRRRYHVGSWEPDDPRLPRILTDGIAAMQWFKAERAGLVAAIRQAHRAGWWQLTCALAHSVSEFFELHGDWDDWQRTQGLALEASRQGGDPHAEALSLASLAILLVERGRHGTARPSPTCSGPCRSSGSTTTTAGWRAACSALVRSR